MRYTDIILLIVFLCSMNVTGVMAQSDEGSEGFYVSGTSDKITLELKGVDIIDVLKVLSKKSGLNIIAGKNVRGQVTLFLQNVDVREALKVVLESSELAYEEENGIIKVITQRDYEAKYGKSYDDKRATFVAKLKYADAESASQLLNEIKTNVGKIIVDDRTNTLTIIDFPDSIDRMKNAIASLDLPIASKVFNLKYGDVEDLEAKITEILTPASGRIRIDKRTNKIAVMDYPERLKQVEEIINAFDEKPRQVLINSKIVQVTLNDDYSFGIDWNFITSHNGKQRTDFDAAAFGTPYATPDYSGNNFTSFTINSATDDFYAVIEALEGMGKTNTLSSPRVTVLNGEEAKLSVATRQPYVSQTVVQGDSSSTTADNVEFVDVGVILTVLPKITDNRMILLKIKPEISSSTESLELEQFNDSGEVTGTRTTVPIVTSQEVETTVLVKNNRTLVIGGLIEDTEAKTIRKLPILGDIPLLGTLFKNETVDNTKSELVIFLTPSIIDDPELTNFEKEYIKYLDEQGQLLDFDKVGDESYDYSATEGWSMSPFESENKPYWKRKQEKINKEVVDHFGQKESQNKIVSEKIRQEPMSSSSLAQEMERDARRISRQRTSVMPSSQLRSSRSIPQITASSRDMYMAAIARQINRNIAQKRELARYRGTTSTVILNVINDGTIDSIGYSKSGVFSQPQVREALTEAIVSSSPFPRFPKEISSTQERFEIQISL
ncbi:secretin N-terminal domain-containing protein [Candidatus Omnitrophota bacterium]